MRRFAIMFGLFVVLVVGLLNFIDARYPDALHRIQAPATVPASAPSTETAAVPPPQAAPRQQAAAPVAHSERVPLEDPDLYGMYPGAHIDRIVYGARPYEDMTVVSVSAQNVVLKNSRELVSIPTGSLPDDLRQMAIAYLNGSEDGSFARAGSPAFPAPATPVPSQPAPAPQQNAVQAVPQNAKPDFEALAWQAARERAERWLRFERERRPTDIVPLLTGVDLKTPLPMTGLPGYWKVRGRGYVATYQAEKGGTFHDFEVTVVFDSKGNVVRADIEIL